MAVLVNKKIEKMYRLSPLQAGFYHLKMVEKSSSEYVIQNIIDAEGVKDEECILNAFRLLSLRYDILRTLFTNSINGELIQIVVKDRYIENSSVDLSFVDAEHQQEEIDRYAADDLARGFDFKKDTLMRVTVFKTGNGKYTILWTFHHIILDGWSAGIIQQKLADYISQLASGTSYETLEARVRKEKNQKNDYSDYIKWLGNRDSKKASEYWSSVLSGYNETVSIKPYHTNGFHTDSIEKLLRTDKHLSEKIEQTASALNVTVSEIFETCWGLLLQRFSDTDDAVFGKVVSGRNANIENIEEIPGLFINTIVTRIDCSEATSFSHLLKKVHANNAIASEYDHMPLSDIQNISQQRGDLIKSIYTFENFLASDIKTGSGISFSIRRQREQTNYPLSLMVYKDGTYCIKLMYDNSIYTDDDINDILKKLESIINEAVTAPDMPANDIGIEYSFDSLEIMNRLSKGEVSVSEHTNIISAFKSVAERYSDKNAVVFNDAVLTYSDVDRISDNVAAYLIDHDLVKGSFVPVMMKKNEYYVCVILGIIKAGAVYVPVDPTYPDERKEHIFDETAPVFIITSEENNDTRCISIKTLTGYTEHENIVSEPASSDSAYMIYTSGTTGRPKGVIVEHHGVVNLAEMFIHDFGIKSSDHILQFANPVFDASVWEMTMAVLTGAELVVLPEDYMTDMKMFEKYCAEHNVNIATLPPQFYIQTNSLHADLIITAGSNSNSSIIKKALDTGRYINAYGPTETTVCASFWEADSVGNDIIPIGRPIRNYEINIIKNGKLCGIGIPGELCVSGSGLARGYFNCPDVTADKFTVSPVTGKRMYRTGDLARWLPDGNIEFLGRVDRQLKIRGFRIEPEEIENNIRNISGIVDSAVTALKSPTGEYILTAFYVADSIIDSEAIKTELRKNLPSYMIPSIIAELDIIPVTRSGKLDVSALPDVLSSRATEYASPETHLEQLLCDKISALLGCEKIGIDDNIIECGMTSLTVTKLVPMLAKDDIHVTIQNIYDNLTVRRLADYIENQKVSEYFVKDPEKYREFNKITAVNTLNRELRLSERDLGKVLLTGAAGFLGIHILHELLKNSDSNIYCLVRSKNFSSAERLNSIYSYYFGSSLTDEEADRITVIDADITSDTLSDMLPDDVSTIIHCAADIRHFGNKDALYRTNVGGTENIIRYTNRITAFLMFISTSSVGGLVLDSNPAYEMNESDYYLDQFFISPYMTTKFESERLVLQAYKEHTNVCIVRVGNLSNRYSDYRTIPNLEDNLSSSLLMAYAQLGCMTEEIAQDKMEFSPVDLTASAIVVLAKHHDTSYNVYHVFNSNKVTIANIAKSLSTTGIEINIVSPEEMENNITDTLETNNKIYEVMKRTTIYDMNVNTRDLEKKALFTDAILRHYGFEWPEINDDYIAGIMDNILKQ